MPKHLLVELLRGLPLLAPLRHADLPMKVGFQEQSGSNADIAKMTRLTLSGHRPRYRPSLDRRLLAGGSRYHHGTQQDIKSWR